MVTCLKGTSGAISEAAMSKTTKKLFRKSDFQVRQLRCWINSEFDVRRKKGPISRPDSEKSENEKKIISCAFAHKIKTRTGETKIIFI
jgi:hypothetical protein